MKRQSNDCPECGHRAAMRAARVRVVNDELVCELTCWCCANRWSVAMPEPARAASEANDE